MKWKLIIWMMIMAITFNVAFADFGYDNPFLPKLNDATTSSNNYYTNTTNINYSYYIGTNGINGTNGQNGSVDYSNVCMLNQTNNFRTYNLTNITLLTLQNIGGYYSSWNSANGYLNAYYVQSTKWIDWDDSTYFMDLSSTGTAINTRGNIIAGNICYTNGTNCAQPSLDSGLVLMMPMSTGATDYSGNNNNGAVSGATLNLTGGFNGKGAYSFDGVNDKITKSNPTLNIGTGSFTISIWVYLKSTAGWQMPFFMGSEISEKGVYIDWDLTNDKFDFQSYGGYGRVLSTNTYTLNNWYHIVAVYNGSHNQLYVNGISAATPVAYSSSNVSNSAVQISGVAGEYWFNGSIDEVRIYNRSLSASEITALYNLRPYEQDNNILPVNKIIIGDFNITANISKMEIAMPYTATYGEPAFSFKSPDGVSRFKIDQDGTLTTLSRSGHNAGAGVGCAGGGCVSTIYVDNQDGDFAGSDYGYIQQEATTHDFDMGIGYGGGALRFTTYSLNEHIRIKNTALTYVGIHDNNPSYTLSVNGTFMVSNGTNGLGLTQAQNSFVGINTTTPLYPFDVEASLSGISIYSLANISAAGYITRTSVYDKTKGSALDYIKDANSYLDKNGNINHSSFYGAVKYKKTDISRPEITLKTILTDNVEFDTATQQNITTKLIYSYNETSYPYTITEEGVDLGAEIDVLRQAVYELNLKLNETCTLKKFSWCK